MYERLVDLMASYRTVLVAYSGGMDSTLVARAARDGAEEYLAVTVDSPLIPRRDIRTAVEVAEKMGLNHQLVRTEPPEDVLSNPRNRCYHCKLHTYSMLRDIAERRGLEYLADGTNVSDYSDVRPGIEAADSLGVVHPLVEAGFTEKDVRVWAARLGLPNRGHPSTTCLASRVPYGTRLEPDILSRVEAAEDTLIGLGIPHVRVRYHGSIARIEVPEEHFQDVVASRERILEALGGLGFKYVTLDLRGYTQGSLNL